MQQNLRKTLEIIFNKNEWFLCKMDNQFVHENPRLIHTAQIICTLRNINIHTNLRLRVAICTPMPQIARLLHEAEKACSRNRVKYCSVNISTRVASACG